MENVEKSEKLLKLFQKKRENIREKKWKTNESEQIVLKFFNIKNSWNVRNVSGKDRKKH